MASILVLCTGNVCRSPIAEALLRAALRARLGEGAPAVTSAGTAGWEGSGAMPESVAAAAEHGVDISDHSARRLVAEHVQGADLIVGMAAEHRDALAMSVPGAASRTFTLKELVRLLEALPESLHESQVEESPGARLAARVAEADALRATGFQGNPHDEDVVDPLGLPLEGYRAIAWELDGWCARLADGLFGRAPARTGAPGAEGE
jgi:protein-tyrosine phosphatase